jgi:hypothetical protein
MTDEPGSCDNPDEPSESENTDSGENTNTDQDQGCGGCSSGSNGGGMTLGIWLIGLLGFSRQRSR